MFGHEGTFMDFPTSDPEIQARRSMIAADSARVYAKLAEYDWLLLDLDLAPEGAGPGYRRELAGRRRLLAKELRGEMRQGLEECLGQPVPEESVYTGFVARRLEAKGLRACECCRLVFKTRPNRPASRCPECQRNPPRYRVFPLAEGGWHIWARVGPPPHHYVDPDNGRPRGVTYVGRCTECGSQFSSERAQTRLCRNCGTPAARVRRLRGGSRLGRQRFRFVGDAPDVTVGVVLADGSHGSISAEDGVLETRDAEIAAQLEANTGLTRLS